MKTKKYFFIIIMFCLVFLAPKKAIALTSGNERLDGLYVGVPEQEEINDVPLVWGITLDGARAYCIDIHTKMYITEYAGYSYSDPRIGYALAADHGYTWNSSADYQIRQAVIWALLGQIDINRLYAGDPGCVQAAKNLYYAAASYNTNVDKPSASSSYVDFNIEGMEYVSNAITVNKPQNNDYYDIILDGFPSGTYITDMNGNRMQTTGITWNSTFQVRIPLEVIKNDITNISMKINGVRRVYNTTTGYHAVSRVSQELLSSQASSSLNTNATAIYLFKPIIAEGDLEVKKSDEYGELVPGTTFQVTNGNLTVTGVTGDDGIARFEDLPAGEYTIIETSAPYGYYNDRVNVKANVITGITVTSEKSDNESKGNVKIIKRDSETSDVAQGDATLAGAIYKIYAREDIYAVNGKTKLYSKGDEVGTCTTGENGESNTVILPLGKYMYREETASNGYLLNDEEIYFSIDYENQDVELIDKTFTSNEDVKKNNIEIIKKLQATDSTPQLNLAGAKFSATLKSDRSKVYYSTVTDDSGYCVIENLPYGTYEIEEIEVPAKALKIDNFDVFVEEDSTEREPYRYTKENVAKKMQITIYKEDRETGTTTQGDARLEDAEYTIYRDEALTDAVETVKIEKQDDGTYSAKTGNYLVGKYYIKETKRPEGYLADEEVHVVEQLGENQSVEFSYHEITSTELVERGNIYIVKYKDNNTNFDEGSTTKEPATGVELTLTLNSNPSVTYTSVVNEIGYAEFIDIPYGWYTITETKSLEFVDIMDPQPVYVSKDGQKLYYIVQDPRNERKLKIVKRDAETGNIIPLAGATFKVWDVAEKRYIKQSHDYPTQTEIDEFVTAADGTLILPDGLIPGEYELEEVTAPYGYTLNETRVPFTIDATTPENPEQEEIITVDFPDTAQKAKVVVYKKGEVLTGTEKDGEITRPVYEEKGLRGVEYVITAKEDIVTPDGTTRMKAGETVTFKTDEDGIGISPELYLGEYTIKETATLDGILLQQNEISFVLEYKGQDLKIYEKNMDFIDVRQKLNLKVMKDMEEPEYNGMLEDAYVNIRLGIYTREDIANVNGDVIIDKDTLVDILTIDENGVSSQNYDLPLGKYYIKEINTNENYLINENEYDFEFKPNDNTTPVIDVILSNTINNNLNELGKFKLYKYAEENKNIIERIADFFNGDTQDRSHALKGAKFKLYYDKNGEPVELISKTGVSEYITDENGEIYVENLPFGKYYYREIEAPKGYDVDDTLYSFEITKDHVEEPLKVEMSNELTDIKLFTKTDAFNSEVIPDCEFEILDKDQNVIYKDKTDENGEFYMPIDLLTPGEIYYYKEISAPEIYELNEELHEFILNEDQTVSITEVENLRRDSTLKINKSDFLGGQKIPNCTFKLESLETDYVVEGTTDENGEYYFENIPYGEYTYTEISAPEEYRIDTTPHRITIDEEMEELNISNELIVNTSDINLMLFSVVLLASAIGITLFVYKNRDKIRENYMNRK